VAGINGELSNSGGSTGSGVSNGSGELGNRELAGTYGDEKDMVVFGRRKF